MRQSTAPGLMWRTLKDGTRVAYWIAPERARRRGYTHLTQRLWSGAGEPAPEDYQKIRISCFRLHREVKEWFANPQRKRPTVSFFKEGNIYFARVGERIKIGFTGRDVRKRLIDIQSMVAEPVELIAEMRGTKNTERSIHARFAHLRHRGEWFAISDELLAFIDANAKRTSLKPRLKHLNTNTIGV